MRALELMNGFSEKELDEVDAIIAAKSRKTLKNLFDMLRRYKKKKTDPSNADIFNKTFGKPYAVKEDYLLRNELRLLSELLSKQLVVNTFKKEIDSDKELYNNWLTKGLFDRKINDIFRIEVEKYVEQGKKSTKPYDAARMLHYKSLWMIVNMKRNAENMHSQLQIIGELVAEEKRNFLYRLRECEARRGYVEYVLAQFETDKNWRNTKTDPLYTIDLHMDDPTGWFEQYLILKKHSFQTTGRARIEVLTNMLAIEEQEQFSGEFAFTAQISTLNNLALENIYIGEFAKADQLLEESFKRCEAKKVPVPLGNYQNYIANKVNLGQYQQGIDAYQKFYDFIINSRVYSTVTLHKAFCLLFLDKTDEALQTLPQSVSTLLPIEKMMVRMVYVIVFLLRNDYDLARNEIQNFGQALKGKDDDDAERYSFIASLFKIYINAFLIGRDKKLELGKLNKKLSQHALKINQLAKSEFCLLWLIRQPGVGQQIVAK